MTILDNITFAIRRQLIVLNLYKLSALIFKGEPVLSILCYHSFSDQNIYSVPIAEVIKQLESLRNEAEFVSLDQVLGYINSNAQLKKPAVAITIDDGYKDALELLPITQKYNIPVTIFVLTQPENADRKELDHQGELLSWGDIQTLKNAGWTIACHGATHKNFAKLTDQELSQEIIESKKVLETKLKTSINYFSYPKGVFNEKIVNVVKQAGFQAAFTVITGSISPQLNKFLLPRTVVNYFDKLSQNPQTYIQGPLLVGKVLKLLNLWGN